MQEIQFDYFHGMEAEQYTFYRIPKNFIYRRMLQNYFLRSKGFIRSVAGPYEPEY